MTYPRNSIREIAVVTARSISDVAHIDLKVNPMQPRFLCGYAVRGCTTSPVKNPPHLEGVARRRIANEVTIIWRHVRMSLITCVFVKLYFLPNSRAEVFEFSLNAVPSHKRTATQNYRVDSPFNNLKKNVMAWVRERTIPTERRRLIGEVSANFCG
jgi:hypothetical protein